MLNMLTPSRRLLFVTALLTIGMLLPGCRTKEERLIPPPVVHTPLEIDPTAPPNATGWWYNGRNLLRLSPDASYALWDSGNRYRVPRERGRWSQPSYAFVRLEPYTERSPSMRRADFVKVDHDVAIRLPEFEPFLAIDQPPTAPEDDLFGEWRGEAGTLNLYPTMRYGFISRTATRERPLVLAGHQGRWQLQDGVLTLRPDVAGMEGLQLPLLVKDDHTTLQFHGGDFRREPVSP